MENYTRTQSIGNLRPMDTLKPIEYIMPNPILLLTEWKTQNLDDREIAFSMEHLYLLINFILEYIFKPGAPSSIITKEFLQSPIDVIEENKLEIIDHYGLALIITIALLLVAIFIPILWLMSWCFCCTNKSPKPTKRSRNYQSYGGMSTSDNAHHSHHHHHHSRHNRHSSSSSSSRQQPKQRSHYPVEKSCDFCFRRLFSTILLSLLVLCFLFIICAFVTNDFVHSGVKHLPKAANNSLTDLEIYLNNTQYELDILFKTNFAQLETQIRKNLNISGEIVKNKLAVISEASSVDNLTQIVTNLQPILQDLKKLINHTNELKFLTVQLRGKFSRTKQDLEDFFKSCKHEICIELEKKYYQIRHSFQISSRIESLPRLSPIIDKIQYLLDRNITGEIRKGKEKLDLISKDIQKRVNEVVPNIRTNIAQANKALIENVDAINAVLAQPIRYIHMLQGQISQSNDFIQKHNNQFHYIGLICTLLLFLILLCYFFGLLSGICNDQPTKYNYKNRSKRADCFTYFGMTIFFTIFTILLSLSTLSFIFGGMNDRSLCYYLENVSNPQVRNIVAIIQEQMNNNNDAIDYNYSGDSESSMELKQLFSYLKNVDIIDIVQRCHQNQSLFNVLRLSNDQKIKILKEGQQIDLNLSEIVVFKEKNNIQNYLNDLLNRLSVNPQNIVLLSEEGKELLQVLKDTPLETLNFSGFANSIKHSITPIDLEMLSRKLENESYRLPEYEIENIAKLRNIVMDLRSAKELINIMTNKIETLTKNAERIEMKSHFNGRSLRETLNILLKQATDAQRFINQKGRVEIKNVLKNFIQDLSYLLSQYSNHVEQRVEKEIGRCEPVSRAYNHTVSSLCDEVVLPFTACWFSVAITLIAFIPSTLFACILVSLFKRVKRSSTRRESILIIDHYEEDIPLAEIDKRINRREVLPSAPIIGTFGDHSNHSEEETWSPSAIPQHLYTRPPPYNF